MGKIGINITQGTLQKKVNNETPVNALAEARLEAQELLDNTKLFIIKNRSFLTSAEVDATNEAVKELTTKMDGNNVNQIYSSIAILIEISRPYAERLKKQ